MNKNNIQKEIKKIKNSLVKKYHPEKIILFGSVVWGKFDKNSDLDFLIIKKDVPHYGRDRLREVYKFVDSSFPVDLLIYKPDEFEDRYHMGDPFIRLIVAKGKIIYG